jgi:hypothetical protein
VIVVDPGVEIMVDGRIVVNRTLGGLSSSPARIGRSWGGVLLRKHVAGTSPARS